jgi:hypothetical protein
MRPVVERAAAHEIRRDFDRLKERLEAEDKQQTVT